LNILQSNRTSLRNQVRISVYRQSQRSSSSRSAIYGKAVRSNASDTNFLWIVYAALIATFIVTLLVTHFKKERKSVPVFGLLLSKEIFRQNPFLFSWYL